MAHPSQLIRINGKAIRSIRESKGLTQLYLASYVGVTTDTISRWENGKTQTVKRENLKKLAEALDVEIEALLANGDKKVEEESGPKGEAGEQPVSPLTSHRFSRIHLLMAVMLAVLLATLLYIWNASRPQQGTLSARRWLPQHAPAQAPFPVRIELDIYPSYLPVNVMITEHLPPGVSFVTSSAAPVQNASPGGAVKWIAACTTNRMTLVYMARMAGPSPPPAIEGEIFIKKTGSKRFVIEGNDTIVPAPFHWADADMNGKIDDGELLTALDMMGNEEALAAFRSEVERLWTASGYRWNPKRAEYEVVK